MGIIVANDINYGRIRALKFNLEKAGVINTVITNQDIRRMEGHFNIILLDAPCSSEGTIRRRDALMAKWSENKIYSCSRLQKQLILKAFDMLVDGGVLLYSTCTFAPEENEEVVDHLLKGRKAEIEPIKNLKIIFSGGITEWKSKKYDPAIAGAMRVWPHYNNSDGFFLAKIRKSG